MISRANGPRGGVRVPVRRIEGMTSDVTHFLNCLALGLVLVRIRV